MPTTIVRHQLDVGIYLNEPTLACWNSVNDRLHAAVGKEDVSAGTGFGIRDVQWQFDTKQEAIDAQKRIMDAFLGGYRLHLHLHGG